MLKHDLIANVFTSSASGLSATSLSSVFSIRGVAINVYMDFVGPSIFSSYLDVRRMMGVLISPVAGPLSVDITEILAKSSQVVGTNPVSFVYALMIGGIATTSAFAILCVDVFTALK